MRKRWPSSADTILVGSFCIVVGNEVLRNSAAVAEPETVPGHAPPPPNLIQRLRPSTELAKLQLNRRIEAYYNCGGR